MFATAAPRVGVHRGIARASTSTSTTCSSSIPTTTRAFLRLAAASPSLPGRSAAAVAFSKQRVQKRTRQQGLIVRAQQEEKPFGYTRKDVLLIGGGLIGVGYGLYYGLQAAGFDAGLAGNYVQLIMVLALCLGWVSTYLFRVATKQMTYAQQLKDYEAAVMAKRLEEMPPEEADRLMQEVEAERIRREEAMARRQQQQQQGGGGGGSA